VYPRLHILKKTYKSESLDCDVMNCNFTLHGVISQLWASPGSYA